MRNTIKIKLNVTFYRNKLTICKMLKILSWKLNK